MINSEFFSNNAPMEWWLNKVKLTTSETFSFYNGCKFIQQLNGDIHDLNNHFIENSYTSKYEDLKNELLRLSLAYGINHNNYDIILKKRSTIHIQELFKKHVEKNTLVIVSSFQHISSADVVNNLPHVFYLDSENNDSSISINIDEAVKCAKDQKYDKIFVYLIATEFQTGRNYSQAKYDELYNKIKELNKESIFVLDAVQEMFLLPRDWSIYDYIIGTAHAMYFGFDTGFLIINTSKQSAEKLTGYKRDDVLEQMLTGLNIVYKRHDYIMMYQKIVLDSINIKLLDRMKLHNSQTNFFSGYIQDQDLLSNNNCKQYIKEHFSVPAKSSDPGVNVEISHHKPIDELYIRLRAQTLMFDRNDIETKLNYFYENWKTLLLRK